MTEENRIDEILTIIQKIEGSKLSIREYFKRNDVPFSRAQYYTSRETLQKSSQLQEEDYKRQKSGGGEILTSLSFFSLIIELFTRTIQKSIIN